MSNRFIYSRQKSRRTTGIFGTTTLGGIRHLPPDKVDKRDAVDTQPPINIGFIKEEEVQEALRTSKTNEAPGPDGLTIEL